MWSQRQRKTSAWVHLITERETFLRICNTYKGNVLLAKGNRLTVITAACKKKKREKKEVCFDLDTCLKTKCGDQSADFLGLQGLRLYRTEQ